MQDCPNLQVFNGNVTRILWQDGRPQGYELRATGAEYVAANGTFATLYTDKEVTLSAGPLCSPGTLESSGVGNPE